MLNSLSIKNYALIEDIELSFDDHLLIITGETGAGKSIILGALSLLLGKRADLGSIKDPQKKCIIEGAFSIAPYDLQEIFETNDLDYEKESIIRREILPSGKSRAFVNDTPVKLKQMSALGKYLVDIHSQNETLFVGDSAYQYQVVDALADNSNLLNDYKKVYKNHQTLLHQYELFKAQQHEAKKTYDYHSFLLNELRESKLKPGLQTELELQAQQLSNVEELKEALSSSLIEMQQEERGITDKLQTVKNHFNRLANFGATYHELNDRLQSVLIEIEDMTVEIDHLAENIEDDPTALDNINAQLHNIYNLQKKHGLSTLKELLTLQDKLEREVATSENADETRLKLENKIKTSQEKVQKIADLLFNRRQRILPNFVRSIESTLAKLGMKDAQLKIEIKKGEDFNVRGNDQMNWLFTANKGARLREIKKSASGGELSRIALVIKSILAQFTHLPTLIFDEIDTGVSGEIAQKMGDIMSDMGKKLQVLSITHLPQIAAKGHHHYKVFKITQNGITQTIITPLNKEERVNEIAEMLGGKERSASAIAHAKALLQ